MSLIENPTEDTIDMHQVRLEGNADLSSIDIIRSDVDLMFKFASNSGKKLPEKFNLTDDDKNFENLISNYNSLLDIVKPATPESILYLNAELNNVDKNGKWYLIPIYTKCILYAVIALLVMIGVSLHPDVNVDNQKIGLLESNGKILLLNLAFICAASLLGVMFYLLKTIGDKIKKSSLMPHDSIQLNAAIIIGIISGFVVTELFALNSDALDNTQFLVIHKMTLALLGGFSSDAIFSILSGIVAKFKNMFSAPAV